MSQPSLARSPGQGGRLAPPLPPVTFLGFLVAVVAILLIAALNYGSNQNRSAMAERVTHTFEVIAELEGLLSRVKDAETGQRGFLLTGVESYLEPYTTAKAALPGEIKAVRTLIGDNGQQQRQLDALDQLTGEKVEELTATIALYRQGNHDAAIAFVRTDRGKTTMDQIRALVSQMERDERTTLATRQADLERADALSAMITLGGSALLLLLVAAAAVITSRDYRARETQVWLRTGQMALSTRVQGE